MPVMPVKVGTGRQQTISVGPIGILVMVTCVYPIALLIWGAGMLAYGLIRLIILLCAAGSRKLRQRRAARAYQGGTNP